MTIGVLGGGQLGRMIALAGYTLGQRFVFLDPGAESSAGHVGNLRVGAYDDEERLTELARKSSIITYEFENVPVGSARFLNELVPVYPPPRALEVSQDRLDEKSFLRRSAFPPRASRQCRAVRSSIAQSPRSGSPPCSRRAASATTAKVSGCCARGGRRPRVGSAGRRVARPRGVRSVRA